MNKTLASLLLATSLVSGCRDRTVIEMLRQADLERPGQMTVTGSATLEVRPDCADLTITLSSEASRPAQTADALGIKLGRVVSVGENQNGMMWSGQYFPSNASASMDAGSRSRERSSR